MKTVDNTVRNPCNLSDDEVIRVYQLLEKRVNPNEAVKQVTGKDYCAYLPTFSKALDDRVTEIKQSQLA
jgi:hypothetical protein